jgi:hypothetical protein
MSDLNRRTNARSSLPVRNTGIDHVPAGYFPLTSAWTLPDL